MSYNKDIDYQAKINEAVKNNDYKSAAIYEQSRNEKIDGENLSFQKTNNYSGWLDDTDYSVQLKEQMNSGAPKSKVSATLKKRINKASGTDGLSHYAYDDVYDAAINYIMNNSGFNYPEEKPEYANKYSDEIEKILDKILNPEAFSYDLLSDEVYQLYKAQYNREGKRAMEDLLGELSMNTGGVASSYAVSAASQMLDNYNNKLTDKIPELYEEAYNRYIDSLDLDKEALALLKSLSDGEYNKYLKELEQYNKDREFSYDVDKFESEQAYDYEKLHNEEAENERKWAQQEYENEQKERQDEIDTALKKWDEMGYLDAESAEILGLPVGLHTSDYDYKRAQEYKLYNR